MTSLLEPGDYGQWVLLIAFQSFCGLFLVNPVDQHIFRQTHAWWDDKTLLLKFTQYNRYISVVSVFISLVVAVWWGLENGKDSVLAYDLAAGLAVGCLVYFGTWSTALFFTLNMLGFRGESIAWALASVVVGLIISTICAFQNPHALSWIFGQIVGNAIGAFGAWRSLVSHGTRTPAPDHPVSFGEFLDFATIRKFCFPLAAATGFMWAQSSGYRFWAGGNWGIAELGILVIGLGVSAQLTAIVESLAMQFLYPFFARQISDAGDISKTSAALSDLMNVLAPVYAIWAGFNAVCASVLLHLLTDSRYHSAVPFVLFGAAIEFARCTTNLWSNTGRAIQQTGGLILPYGIGAAIVAIGSFIIEHFHGELIALAGLLVFAGVATCIAMMIQMQKRLSISVRMPRLVFGISVMFGSFSIAIVAPIEAVSIAQSIAILLVIGVLTLCLIVAVLWRNPALHRLLAAPLRVRSV